MNLRDAFAQAFDSATNGGLVHHYYEFKVKEYKRGEGTGKLSKKAIAEADDLSVTEDQSIDIDPSSQSCSLDEALALDATPTKTPFEKCKAKNPMRCRYHGADAIADWFKKAFVRHGATVYGLEVKRKDGDAGIYSVSFATDPKTDIDTVRRTLLEFKTLDEAIEEVTPGISEYEVDELDPDDEFEDEFEDEDKKVETPSEPTPPKDGEEPPSTASEEPLKDALVKGLKTPPAPPTDGSEDDSKEKPKKEHKPKEEKKRKKVDAVGLLADASKAITGAAKSINRHIDRGDFRAGGHRVDAALKYIPMLEAMGKDTRLPEMFRTRAGELLNRTNQLKESREDGYKSRITPVPYFEEEPFRKAFEEKMAADKKAEEEAEAARRAEAERLETIFGGTSEGAYKEAAAAKESADYLTKILSDAKGVSPSLTSAIKGMADKELSAFEEAKKIGDDRKAKEDAKRAKAEEETAATSTSEPETAAPVETTETPPVEKPKTTKSKAKKAKGAYPTDTKLDIGSSLVADGDTGKDINKKRVEQGLPELVALKHIDTKVKNRTENFRLMSKKLAEEYGDPELDISDPEVFDAVNRNFAETIKRISNEGQFGSFLEPSHITQFLNEGKYRVSWGGHRAANLAYAYGIARKDWDEAAISTILLPGSDERAFDTKCSDRFGAAFIEWDKQSDLVPCFSSCDADEPANQARAHSSSEQAFNPTLVSNPTIASLPAFTRGDADITEATGYDTPSGKKMPTWVNTIKLLRKGPLDVKDAKDFNNIVNGENKWKDGLMLFGWNEAPLLGSGTPKKVRAIHISSRMWDKLRKGSWTHGTTAFATAKDYVESLKTSHGAKLKENNIKIILDGKEVEV